jgi:hypothetical protein
MKLSLGYLSSTCLLLGMALMFLGGAISPLQQSIHSLEADHLHAYSRSGELISVGLLTWWREWISMRCFFIGGATVVLGLLIGVIQTLSGTRVTESRVGNALISWLAILVGLAIVAGIGNCVIARFF